MRNRDSKPAAPPGLPRAGAHLVLATLLVTACGDGPSAEQMSWTSAEQATFKSFRESAGRERLELGRELVHMLPKALNTVTLEVEGPGPKPSEAAALQQIGAPDASFPLDHHPGFIGGRVAATVQLQDYRIHIYELGCNDGKPARAERPADDRILCSALELVALKQQLVHAFIVHERPQRLVPWLSAH